MQSFCQVAREFYTIGIMKLFQFVLVLLVCLAMPVQAANVDMKNIKPLGKLPYLSQAEFEKATTVVRETPYQDDALSYEIRLPKDWLSVELPPEEKPETDISKNLVGVLAKYASPAKLHRRSFVTIEAQGLSYEIGARNWFLNYLENTGYTLEAIGQEAPDHSSITAVYIMVEGDISYAVRVKTFINGPRIVIARYFVPVELFKADQVMQGQSIDSFKLTGKRLDQIEKRETYGFLDQAYFDYPVSWKISAPNVVTIERMRAMIYRPGPNNSMQGQINIYLTSRFIDTTLNDELKSYIDKLNVPGYKIGKKIETLNLLTHDDMEFSKTEAYEFVADKTHMHPYELWATLMQSEGFYYIVTMMSPGRDIDFYQWARNVRAYEVVVGNIRQYDPAIDQYKYSD